MTSTEPVYLQDAYRNEYEATLIARREDAFATDATVFYAQGGGQAGDSGSASLPDGRSVRIENTVKVGVDGLIWHVVAEPDRAVLSTLDDGTAVLLKVDWDRRYALMRLHSAMHMLCALIDAPVTGGSIHPDRARLDFDLENPIDKAALNARLAELIANDAPMSSRLISDAELDAQPELVRTLSVQPPRNAAGTIRLVEFAGIDLQPCGGTHVRSTAEIGNVLIRKIEKKGKQNRRLTLVFAD